MPGTNDQPPPKDQVAGEPTPADPRYADPQHVDQNEPINRDVDYRSDGVGRAEYVEPRETGTPANGRLAPPYSDADAPYSDAPASNYPLADRAGYPDTTLGADGGAYTDANRTDYFDRGEDGSRSDVDRRNVDRSEIDRSDVDRSDYVDQSGIDRSDANRSDYVGRSGIDRSDANRSDYVDSDRTAAYAGSDAPHAAHPGTVTDTTPQGTVTDTIANPPVTDVRPSGLVTDPATGAVIDRDGTAAGAPVDPTIDERDKGGYRISRLGGFLLGIVRILAGWIFLWDFIDKTFGLGKVTPSGSGWIDGTRPTEGFLQSVVAADSDNPFKPMFQFFLDQSWTDWLFMAGLLLVGVALILGLLTWVAAIGGAIIMVLIYLASWPLDTNNPFLDYHLFVAVTLLALAASNAGAYLGLGKPWRTKTVYRKRKVEDTTSAA